MKSENFFKERREYFSSEILKTDCDMLYRKISLSVKYNGTEEIIL